MCRTRIAQSVLRRVTAFIASFVSECEQENFLFFSKFILAAVLPSLLHSGYWGFTLEHSDRASRRPLTSIQWVGQKLLPHFHCLIRHLNMASNSLRTWKKWQYCVKYTTLIIYERSIGCLCVLFVVEIFKWLYWKYLPITPKTGKEVGRLMSTTSYNSNYWPSRCKFNYWDTISLKHFTSKDIINVNRVYSIRKIIILYNLNMTSHFDSRDFTENAELSKSTVMFDVVFRIEYWRISTLSTFLWMRFRTLTFRSCWEIIQYYYDSPVGLSTSYICLLRWDTAKLSEQELEFLL
jgi:hypothetical protein